MVTTSLDQLLAFIFVAEESSYSKAAIKLRKSRSTLHHQVECLEIDWGVKLIDRGSKNPKLTEQGKSLLPKAKHILQQLESLEMACDSLVSGGVMEITVGYDMLVPVEALVLFDCEMGEKHPNTNINWVKMSPQEAITGISDGKCDLAITLNQGRKTPEGGISFVNLGYPEFSFYADANSPLFSTTPVTLERLEYSSQLVSSNFIQTKYEMQVQLSSQTKVVDDMSLMIKLLKGDRFALLPKYSMMGKESDLKKLNLDFMLKEGRIGFTLLSKPRIQGSEPHKVLTELICQWFSKIK